MSSVPSGPALSAIVAIGVLLSSCSLLVKTDDLAGGGDGGQGCSKNLTSDASNCGTCGHSCLGGACSNSTCLPATIAMNQAGPLGIAVSADSVFWVTRDRAALFRADKNGANLLGLGNNDPVTDPFDVAVEGETLYWSELGPNTVQRRPLAGGQRGEPIPGPGNAGYLAVEAGDVFLADYRPAGGNIIRNLNVLFPEMDTVSGLAVRTNRLYWARQTTRKIMSGSVMGGMLREVTMAGGEVNGVAVDEQNVYWVESQLRVVRADLNSGTPRTLYTADAAFGESDIAVDDTAIYWTENKTGLVRRLAKPLP